MSSLSYSLLHSSVINKVILRKRQVQVVMFEMFDGKAIPFVPVWIKMCLSTSHME